MSSDINVQTFSGKVNINNNLLVGSSHLFVDTVNNRVGITTAEPGASLEVNGNVHVGTDLTLGGILTGDGSGLANVNSDSGLWAGAGTGSVYLSTLTDKVGIGTSSPGTALDVNGTVTATTFSGALSGNASTATTLQTARTIGGVSFDGSANITPTTFGGATFSGDVAFDTNTLFVDVSANRVGIGTSSPQQKLEVHGNILLGQNDIQSFIHGGSSIAMSSDTHVLIVSDANNTSGAATGGDIIFGAGSAINTNTSRNFTYTQAYPSDVPRDEHVRILGSNGNVGIGTTNPTEALHIYRDGTDPTYIWAIGNTSDRAGIAFSEDTSSKHAIIEYNGTGSDAENYLAIYSGVSGWTSMGAGLNFIPANGRVGIGTSGPDAKLHVNGNTIIGDVGGYGSGNNTNAQLTLGGTHNTGYNLNSGIKLLITGGNNDGSSPYYIMCEDENGYDLFYLKGATSEGGVGLMYVNSDVGVGLTNPGTINGVPSTSVDHHVVGRYILSEPGDDEHWSISTNNNFDLKRSINGLGYIDAARIRFNDGAYENMITFTGQHRSSHIENVTPRMASEYEGLIVCANRDNYESVNGDKKRGNHAITINEAVPLLSLSSSAMDKTCFGVISNSEDPDNRIQKFGNFLSHHFKMNGDEHIFINSIGEGGIWVVNVNGPLESGDYITTSNIRGYGMKQDDQFLANYTVAKITMNCNFDPQDLPIQYIVQQEKVVTKYLDIKNNIVSTEEESHSSYETNELVNVLDENGQIQWENDPSGATEKAYKTRYLLPDGTQISEEEYTTRALADEKVYIAAFVGCTYHCG